MFDMELHFFKKLLGLPKSIVLEFVQQRENHITPGHPSIFSSSQEILILLLWLRHYPVDIFLGSIFHSSKQTIRNTRIRMLHWMYDLLKDRLSLRSLEYRLEHSCRIFNTRYTYVLDGTEQAVTGSNNGVIDTRFYSAKKKKHTVNVLIVSTVENHKVLWISKCFPGSYNDQAIVDLTRAEWYDKFHPLEWGAGDHGFDASRKKGMNIDTPPDRCYPLFRIFSKKRVGSEWVNEYFHNWAVTRLPIRTPVGDPNMLDIHTMAWRLVGVFINDFWRL